MHKNTHKQNKNKQTKSNEGNFYMHNSKRVKFAYFAFW